MKTNLVYIILFPLAIAGGTFIIFESAGYYTLLYSQNQVYMAWFAAILLEVFQHALIIMPGETPLQNRLFKTIALLILVLTIAAAGYKIYKPALNSVKKSLRESRLIKVIEQEIADNKGDQQSFLSEENRQKINAAKSVNARRESSRELKEVLRKPTDDKEILLMSEIFHLFLVRLAIQTASLAFSWKIGKTLRRKKEATNPRPREVVKRWRVKHLRSEYGFVGIIQFNDGGYMSITRKRRKPYKTWNGALQFFNGTQYEGKIPIEPTTIESGEL